MSDDAPLSLSTTPGPCLVGYSGGLDSTVLLHRLASDPQTRARGLRAIHVHHGLHPDADAWAAHCAAVCTQLDVPLTVARVRVDRDSGLGLEGAARAARLDAFAAALKPDETLALAHHREDQAETVLLRLLRAAGSDGLAAMRAARGFGDGCLWRPLLTHSRADLRRYAERHRLTWIEDPSNAESGPDRNFLRLQVLPVLATRWPHATDALARSAGLLAEDVALLAEATAERLARARSVDPAVLSLPALLGQAPAWRARVLRAWLHELGLPPLPGHAVGLIEREVLTGRTDAQPAFRWSGALLQRWRDQLHAGTECAPLPSDWEVTWDGRAPLPLPTGDVLAWRGAAPAPARAFVVRARRGGERIRLPGRRTHHALKHVLPALGVPPWERARLPLVFAPDGELLAAGDVVASAGFDAWCRAHGGRLQLSPAITRD